MYPKLRTTTLIGRSLASLLILIACGVIAGCGTSSDNGNANVPDSVAGLKPPTTGALPTSGCGSIPPAAKPLDPDGVVAKLPDGRAKYYSNYRPGTVRSAYSDWKSKKKTGFTVGIVWGALTTDYQVDQYTTMQKLLRESPLVDKVIAKNTANNSDVGAELQLFRQMLESGVDAIIVQPLTGDSFISLVDEAKNREVPVITSLGAVDSAGAINLDFNSYTTSAEGTARAMAIIGGKGNVLYGAGLSITSIDADGKKGFDAVVKRCPDVEVVGSIYSGYVNSVAKGETLKFLATHPEDINLVFAVGPFASGMIQGFDQAGRLIPAAIDLGGTKGVLGYWNQNPDYQAVSEGVTAAGYSNATVSVLLRTLLGQGPKVNNMLAPPKLITRENLSEWVEPNWNINTQGQPPGPEGAFFPDSYIDGFFNNPSIPGK